MPSGIRNLLRTRAATFVVFAFGVWGCGHSGDEPIARDAHDTPVAASEPRAEINVIIDLPEQNDCDERFDLALYRDRAVELVEWDKDAASSCAHRKVKVRYLSSHITRDALFSLIQKFSRRAEVTTQ